MQAGGPGAASGDRAAPMRCLPSPQGVPAAFDVSFNLWLFAA